jgi:hypothetical protein
MMEFSGIRNFEGDPSVKQVLVYADRMAKDAGIITYKINAVLQHNEMWRGVVRSGTNGFTIIGETGDCEFHESAICGSIKMLYEYIHLDFLTELSKFTQNGKITYDED